MNKISNKDKYLYMILILALVIAWSGIIDRLAYEQNLESMKENVAVILLLKAFNVITSFANGIPVVGGMFEPFDDFMDRLANVMFIATASLGIQKIIIVLMESFIINLFLSLNVFVVISNSFKNFLSNNLSKKLTKLVVLLLFIRFAIPILTFTSVTLESQLESFKLDIQDSRMKELENKLAKISGMSDESDKQKRLNDIKREELETELVRLEDGEEIIQDQQKIIRNKNKTTIDKMTSYFEEEKDTPEISKELENSRKKIEEIRINIDSTKIKIKNLESPSFFDNFNITDKARKLKVQINALAEDMIDTFFTAVLIFAFINLIFPIFFLWALFKLVDRSFSTNYTDKLNKSIANKKEELANEQTRENK